MDINKDKLLTIRVLAIILAFFRAAASRSFNIKYFCNNAYYRWYNDGERVECSMPDSREEESVVYAFNYLYQFRDAASGFSGKELMENVVAADTEEDYEMALEAAADAIIGWAAKQPDTPNEDDFLDKKFLGEYNFDFYREEEDEEEYEDSEEEEW